MSNESEESMDKLSSKQRAIMVLYPPKYFKQPTITSRDCCLCCHETELKLNIPPLIEISGTWMRPQNPINRTFIFFRFIFMIYIVYCAVFSFILYEQNGHIPYYFMYYTQC